MDGLPTSGIDQSCAFCWASPVSWVHPLDPQLVRYRVYHKAHTLPSFWTLCDDCEHSYQAGDNHALVERMGNAMVGFWETEEDVRQTIQKPVDAFTRADRGARRLR
nr:hypothetical protein [Micromonospora sp. DSM 115978]